MDLTDLLLAGPDHGDRRACVHSLRCAGFRVVAAAGQGAGGPAPELSHTWGCRRCGTERHFARPVPAAAASPCAGCGKAAPYASGG